MNRMTLERTKPGCGHRSWGHMICALSLMLLLVLSLSACGASNWERLRASGALSSGEVILGESGSTPDAAGHVAGNTDLIAGESAAGPSDSAQPIIPNDGLNGGPGDTPQKEGTDASSPAVETAASLLPAARPDSSADMRSTPLPDAPATPEPKQASANAGIIVRSENILSTNEKEALLNELEKELNGLFGAIDQVSTEQQAGQAE